MQRRDAYEGPGDRDCRYDREAEDPAMARDLVGMAGRFIRAEQQTATCGKEQPRHAAGSY
jgi:hypothetical protein